MKQTNDFDINLTKVKKSSKGDGEIRPMVTSKSLCTPGCITGILMGCNLQTATCGCHITGK